VYFPDYSLNRVLYWGNTAANAGLVVYSVRSIALILRFMFVKEVKPVFELRFLLCYMSGIILFAVLTFVASLTMNNRLLVVSVAALSFLGFLYYFMSIRYPEFLKLASQEARAVRVKTLIDDNNSSEILRMMDSLMHEKKLFTDEGLSVGKTAEALGVTAHLLSRIINEKTGNNFRAYLNSFRVKEASALLLGNPDMSVIEIAYAVGFSSKSSFNEVFHRITGVSPREYRIRAGRRVEPGDL
jgi:AraC-like DNA-binding protein